MDTIRIRALHKKDVQCLALVITGECILFASIFWSAASFTLVSGLLLFGGSALMASSLVMSERVEQQIGAILVDDLAGKTEPVSFDAIIEETGINRKLIRNKIRAAIRAGRLMGRLVAPLEYLP